MPDSRVTVGLVCRYERAKRLHAIRIEGSVDLVIEQRECALGRPRRPIDAVCRQRVVYVGDREDADGEVEFAQRTRSRSACRAC
jgi:hypothetical protein